MIIIHALNIWENGQLTTERTEENIKEIPDLV